MKDLMLIIVTFAAFAFGFYIMKKIDDFIADNQRHITAENRNSRSHIHIAAESPMLLDYVASALEYCSAAHPYMEFFFSSGKVNQLLHKLSDGTVDIVLLSDEIAKSLSSEYVSIQIPYHAKQAVVTTLGLNVENTDQVEFLRRIHCDMIQGYIYSGPVTIEAFEKMYSDGLFQK